MLPRSIFAVNSLPVTASGKPDKKALLALFTGIATMAAGDAAARARELDANNLTRVSSAESVADVGGTRDKTKLVVKLLPEVMLVSCQ